MIFIEYTYNDLKNWCEKIECIAGESGLDFYPQEFEIVNYKDMIGYEAYVGMPSRYPHWSFGKAYERTAFLYKYDLTGLPYEMVINSNPCLAYLMKDNTLLLQILTMAHVYGHNDFFKNNRLFKEGTNADYTIEMFKNHADMVREYINDPSIGYDEVENVLNSAHAIRFQTERAVGMKKEISHNLIEFITCYGNLPEWKKNVLNVVKLETNYFVPQVETKIMNEGWASYWHYKILNKLNLPQSLHLEFIKRHNDVIVPTVGRINPYHLGFNIFKYLEEKYGTKKIFEARMLERDESFIRRYLTKEMCDDLNLFQYGKECDEYVVKEISDDEGWKKIRDTLCSTCGMNMIPEINAEEILKDGTLVLKHVFDGRELQKKYMEETLKYVYNLWGNTVELKTVIEDKKTTVKCEENNIISYC